MKTTIWMTVAAMLAIGAADTGAQPAPRSWSGALTFTVENDFFTGTDNYYSNGFGATWVSNAVDTYGEGSFVKKWARFCSFLPFVGSEGRRDYVSWSLAQEMHTPDNITNPNPPLDDQPYAGILYLDSVMYSRGERAAHAWQLRVGVVGPGSLAEGTQKWFHQVIGDDEPMGWDTQLPGEPVLNLGYTGAYILAQGHVTRAVSWRLIPVANAGLGNYFTGAGAGAYGEVGFNLVEALGGTALRQGFNAASTAGVGPVERLSVSVSGGLAGYAVGHYLPLDGTVTRDSRSVDSEPYIGMATVGFNLRYHGFVAFLGRTYFTDTFSTERSRAEFGTLSLSWYY